ncbi:MAG: PKD domain-containing protein [Siphonobacter sp.]
MKYYLPNLFSVCLLSLILFVFLFTGCRKDIPRREFTPCGSASPQGTYALNGLDVTFTLTSSSTTIEKVEWNFGDGTGDAAATGMTPTHTYASIGEYTVIATITNKCGDSETKEIVVSLSGNPAVISSEATNITYNQASFSLILTTNGNSAVTKYGYCYSTTNTDPTIADSIYEVTGSLTSGETKTLTIPNLSSNTKYYVKAYVVNSNGTGYSDIKNVTTSVDLVTGLIAYYQLNGNTNDASGYENNGTLPSGGSYTSGHTGTSNSALLLDGVDDYMNVPDAVSLRPSKLTVSMWFKANSLATSMHLFQKSTIEGNSFGYNGAIKYLGTTLAMSADITEATNCDDWITNLFTPKLTTNTWYHFVAVFDGTNSIVYLNGSPVSTVSAGLLGETCSLGAPLRFGMQWFGEWSYFFNGAFDDIRIYNTPLTQAQVTALYNQ